MKLFVFRMYEKGDVVDDGEVLVELFVVEDCWIWSGGEGLFCKIRVKGRFLDFV